MRTTALTRDYGKQLFVWIKHPKHDNPMWSPSVCLHCCTSPCSSHASDYIFIFEWPSFNINIHLHVICCMFEFKKAESCKHSMTLFVLCDSRTHECLFDQTFLDRDRWAEVSLSRCHTSRNPPTRGIVLQVPERVKKLPDQYTLAAAPVLNMD